MQDYNHKAKWGTNAFILTELRILHVFTVGCSTFAQILLPLQTVNDLLWHHHHWMEWFRPTIQINGFSMVLGSDNHWKRWFSMVFHHWSNDGMVTYHRWSLHRSNHQIRKNLEIKFTSDTQSSILASLIPFPLAHPRWPACHQISFQRQKKDFSKVDREWTIKIAAGQVGSKCSRHLWNSLATHRAQTVIRGNAAIFNSAASNNCSVTLSILKLQKLKPRFEDILTLRNSTWLQL